MNLRDLSPSWEELSKQDKIALIEKTNLRRVQAFELRTQRKQRKPAVAKKGTTKKLGVDKVAILAKNKMTNEERKNLILLLQADEN